MAATAGIGGICIDQTRVVTAEFAVRVTDRPIPPRASSASKTELHGVVAADGLNYCRAFGTERRRRQCIHTRIVGYNDRAVQKVGERRSRVPDVEPQTIRDRHVFDRVLKTATGITG